MKENNKRQKSAEQKEEEILNEIKRLADRAQETSNSQLDLFNNSDLGEEDIDNTFDTSGLDDTADPDLSHRLYYGMRRLLMDNLPKGEENKKFRQFVYDEKSLFLNRGKEKDQRGIRGSDERMTYIDNFLRVAFDVVINWIKTGCNPHDIHQAFYDLNEKHGFHKK